MRDEPTFAGWLRQARRAADLTQEALAEAVGCAAQTLRAFESGRRRPSREMAIRFAQVLHIPPSDCDAFVRLARTTPAADASLEHGSGISPHSEARVTSSRHATTLVNFQPPVLATKLYRPSSDTLLVRRQRLFERLDGALSRPLTVVAAPAGSGKTTLISNWLATRQQASGQPLSVAWLTLDADDSDPVRFLRYLIAALQTVAPSAGTVTLSLLDLPHVAPITTLMMRLVNELNTLPDPTILVLDDYHTIESLPVHQALGVLLERLPPQLHLVIGSRTDPPLPLARLRARRQLVEIRASHLRFMADEVAAFLVDVMALPLTAEDIAILEQRTEGWIAGLQLAALSLQDRPEGDLTPLVAAFAGSHRFIIDYLADEVLSQQPAHVQHFLLATSVLERMCASLCDAVLGSTSEQHTSDSQAMLEYLEHSNLFIVPLDDERTWYRYHHLFGHVLRQRLLNSAGSNQARLYHTRAAAWFERQGLIVEAIGHLSAAHEWPHTAELIGTYGRRFMVRGQVHTVLEWLAALPADLRDRDPKLHILQAIAAFFHNQHDITEQHLHAAEDLLTGEIDPERENRLGYIAMLRASVALFRGDLAGREQYAAQALALLPPTEIAVRRVAQAHLVLACERSGEAGPAQERQLADLAAASDEPGNALHVLTSLAALYHRQGRLRRAAETYQRAAQAIPDPIGRASLPNGASYAFGLGALHYEWNDLDQAEALCGQGQAIVRAMSTAEAAAIIRGYDVLARLHLARGDRRMAEATLDELAEVARRRRFAPAMELYMAAVRARLALQQNDLASAQRWAAHSGLPLEDAPDFAREMAYLTLARVSLAAGSTDLRNTLALLERMLRGAETQGRGDSVIDIRMLQALAYQAQHRPDQALDALEQALQLAKPEGYIRRFVDAGEPMAALLREATSRGIERQYSAMLLAAFPAGQVRPSSLNGTTHTLPLGETLTEREREVLRLLADGQSNQAIADALVLAVGTVKRHMNNIFAKLDVQSRLQAVARARELDLL